MENIEEQVENIKEGVENMEEHMKNIKQDMENMENNSHKCSREEREAGAHEDGVGNMLMRGKTSRRRQRRSPT